MDQKNNKKEINKRWNTAGTRIPKGYVSYAKDPYSNRMRLAEVTFEANSLSEVKGITIIKHKIKELELEEEPQQTKKKQEYTG